MRPPGSVLILACGCAMVLSACSGPRSGISVRSNVDACAAALPVARAAVHQHGKLKEVHAVHRGELRKLANQLGLPPPPSSSSAVSPEATLRSASATSTPPANVTIPAPSTLLSGTSLPPEPEPQACLVAFQGSYRAAAVDHPIGDPTGQYAIVLVRLHKARLVVVIIAGTLPEPLRK